MVVFFSEPTLGLMTVGETQLSLTVLTLLIENQHEK